VGQPLVRPERGTAERESAMTRVGVCTIGVAIMLLIVEIANAQEASKMKETKTPINTSGMTTGKFGQIAAKARAMEDAKSCGQRNWGEFTPFSLEQLAGGKVKRIRVVRAETYRISSARKPEEVRATIEKIWSRKFGWKACQIEWAEWAPWSIQAELEFEDGKKGVLITDGWHVALQDHEGHNWFVR